MKLKDGELCADMGSEGATCMHTLTDETRDIEKEQWDVERFGQLCTQPEVWADLKSALLRLCRISRACTYEVRQLIYAFGDRIVDIQNKTAIDGKGAAQ